MKSSIRIYIGLRGGWRQIKAYEQDWQGKDRVARKVRRRKRKKLYSTSFTDFTLMKKIENWSDVE